MGMDGTRLLMIGCQWLVRMVGFQLAHPLPEIPQREPRPAPPPPSHEVTVSPYQSDLDKVLREGLPAGSLVSPVNAFIPEHAQANHQILQATPAPHPEGPTTEETIQLLKSRLVKELYRLELDLQGGLRIAGKPCDCAGAKHNVGVEATAEELISYEANPVYGQVIDWYRRRLPEFDPAVIATKPVDYYRAMTPEVRSFRKALVGDTVVQI